LIIDSSVFLAILQDEPEADAFRSRIVADPTRLVGAATLVETKIVVLSHTGEAGLLRLQALIEAFGIQTVAVAAAHADLAVDAFRRFGKGRHPAGLNFGDCLAYALARATGEKLLYKGSDFAQTDIGAA
jgi:ribonuclease VapC